MKTVCKKDLIERVAKKNQNINATQVNAIINSFITEIKKSVYDNEKVVLHGFVRFNKKECAIKKFYNFANNKICKTKKHDTVICKVSKSFKKLNKYPY